MNNNLYLGLNIDHDQIIVSYIYKDISDIIRFDGKSFYESNFDEIINFREFSKSLSKKINNYLKNNIQLSFEIVSTSITIPYEEDDKNSKLFTDLVNNMKNSELFGENVFTVYYPYSATIAVSEILRNLNLENIIPINLAFFNINKSKFRFYATSIEEDDINILDKYEKEIDLFRNDTNHIINEVEKSIDNIKNIPKFFNYQICTGDLKIFKDRIDKDIIKRTKNYPSFSKTVSLNELNTLDYATKYGILSYGSAILAKYPYKIKKRLGFNLYMRFYEELKDSRLLKQAKRYENHPKLIVSNDDKKVYYDLLILDSKTKVTDKEITIPINKLLKDFLDLDNIYLELSNKIDFVVEKRGNKNLKHIKILDKQNISDTKLTNAKISLLLSHNGEIEITVYNNDKKISSEKIL